MCAPITDQVMRGLAKTEQSLGHERLNSVELDTDEALAYNRARCYDPTTGRWISADPLVFDSGNANCYRYVTAEPGAPIPNPLTD